MAGMIRKCGFLSLSLSLRLECFVNDGLDRHAERLSYCYQLVIFDRPCPALDFRDLSLGHEEFLDRETANQVLLRYPALGAHANPADSRTGQIFSRWRLVW